MIIQHNFVSLEPIAHDKLTCCEITEPFTETTADNPNTG